MNKDDIAMRVLLSVKAIDEPQQLPFKYERDKATVVVLRSKRDIKNESPQAVQIVLKIKKQSKIELPQSKRCKLIVAAMT